MSSVMGGSKVAWAAVATIWLALCGLSPNEAAAADAKGVRPAAKAKAADAVPAKAHKKGERAANGKKAAILGAADKPASSKPGGAKPRAAASKPRPGQQGAAKPKGVEALHSGKPRSDKPSASGDGKQPHAPLVKGQGAKPSVAGVPRGTGSAAQGRPGELRPLHPVPRRTTTVTHHKPAPKPEPKIERANTFAVGARGGALLSMPAQGTGVASDGGLGLALRYRPLSFLGVEGSFMHFDSDNLLGADAGFASYRSHNSFSGSVQLFLSPGQVVSPYASVGGTFQTQAVSGAAPDTSLNGADAAQEDVRRGLHGGLGVEFALGQHVGLGLEARYLTDTVHPDSDPLSQGQVQGLLGLNLYF
jgi:opacity protein-like surface antigen